MATLYWPLVSALGCGQGPGGRKEPVGPVTGKPGAGLVGPGRRLGRRPSLNALFALGDLIRTSQRMDPPGPWARPSVDPEVELEALILCNRTNR